jgi:hypothetical protein
MKAKRDEGGNRHKRGGNLCPETIALGQSGAVTFRKNVDALAMITIYKK